MSFYLALMSHYPTGPQIHLGHLFPGQFWSSPTSSSLQMMMTTTARRRRGGGGGEGGCAWAGQAVWVLRYARGSGLRWLMSSTHHQPCVVLPFSVWSFCEPSNYHNSSKCWISAFQTWFFSPFFCFNLLFRSWFVRLFCVMIVSFNCKFVLSHKTICQ